MKIRKAGAEDRDRVTAFARKHGMANAGMEEDAFLLAEDGGRLAGVIGLKKHPDCLELCALCVEDADRGTGLGRILVEEVVRLAGGPIHLTTIIPGFFEKCGFVRTSAVPAGMKKDPDWCEGCDMSRCTVMIREIR
ncbi:MAG TPA: GNAT family N-acetyltransferase [Acidobacteriota bacterium]|nr:GNAT family N-acetyltransferase [Acidobacteriota bacterium]